MKSVLTALIAFVIGVYVGKPAQIVLPPQDKMKDCTIIKTEYEPIAGGSITEALKRVEAAHAHPEGTPTPSSTDDNAKNAEVVAAQPSPDPDLPHDEVPIPDGKKWAKEEISDMARMTLRYPQEIHQYTFSTVEYAHIDVFRAELAAQGLVILQEGPPAVGKWMWVMQIVGPNYVKEPPQKD